MNKELFRIKKDSMGTVKVIKRHIGMFKTGGH